MILTCPKCDTQYKLAPEMLGAAGREVRCVSCTHTWFQVPEAADKAADLPEERGMAEEALLAPAETPAQASSIDAALGKILEQDDEVFKSILSEVNTAKETLSHTIESAKQTEPVKTSRDVSVPRQEVRRPIVTHNPLGVGANLFGVLIFLFFTFLTLAGVFLAQKPILRHLPQMAAFYQKMGMHVKAPGEGLRLDEVVAEQRIGRHDKILIVEGRLTNMTEKDIPSPELHVMMKNNQAATIKSWDVRPSAAKIAAGSSTPMMLQLNDAPENGATIELRVKDE